MILVGELALWIALLMAAWATTVSFAGGALRRDDAPAPERPFVSSDGLVSLSPMSSP